MIETYTTNMSSNKSTQHLNACIKSLYNFIDSYQFKTTDQDYCELSYNGPINKLKIDIKFPRQLGRNIPVIGYFNGSIPVYLGTTNGVECNVKQPSISSPPSKDDYTENLGTTWHQYDDQNNPSTIEVVESDTTSTTTMPGGVVKTIHTVITLRETYTGTHKEESYQHGEKYRHYYEYRKSRVTNTTTTYGTDEEAVISVLMRI